MATLKSAVGDASTSVRTTPTSVLVPASLRPTLETCHSETGQSEPYDEYPVPGLVAPERIIAISPFADVQTEVRWMFAARWSAWNAKPKCHHCYGKRH